MNKNLVLIALKQYFKLEISNKMTFGNDNIQLFINDCQKIKIYTKEKA